MNKLTKCAHLIMMGLFLVSMTGCEDGNLFGKVHKTGESSDVQTLSAEAQDAYRSRDYSRALELYNRILQQDPDNALALYGAAAAAIGSSGFNAATLVNNVLNQSNTTFVNGVGDLITSSRETIYPSAQVASNSILAGVDLARLGAVLDRAICNLQTIVSGASDGAIAQNNLDLLVNYGLLLLIRAVLRPLDAGLIDVTNTNGEYEVVVDPDLDVSLCSGGTVLPRFSSASEQNEFLINIARDLASGYTVYNRAVQNSSLGSNSLIGRLTADLAELNQEFLAVSGDVPQECLDLFDAAGIDVNNFGSYTGAFAPPSGC